MQRLVMIRQMISRDSAESPSRSPRETVKQQHPRRAESAVERDEVSTRLDNCNCASTRVNAWVHSRSRKMIYFVEGGRVDTLLALDMKSSHHASTLPSQV